MLLDRFRRTTRDGRWLAEIDGLRFLAIAGVVLFHMYGELQQRSGRVLAVEPRYAGLMSLIGNGDRGVRLFFVISGFILALPFARQYLAGGPPVSLRKFYLRRLTRLEPPFLVATALTTAMILIYTRGAPAPGFYAHLAATSFYLHGLIYKSQSWVNPVTWSLEIEVQFYVLVPLMALLLKIRPAPWRRAIFLAIILLCGALQVRYLAGTIASGSLLFYVQYFLTGVFIADLYTLEFHRLAASAWWDLLGLACLAFTLRAGHDWTAMHALLPLVFLLLFAAAFKSRLLRAFLTIPWIAVCGGMCYSIYLLHLTWMAAFFHVTRRAILFQNDFLANYLIQMVVTILPILLVSATFYLLIEKPCMDPAWPARLWHRMSGRRAREAQSLDASGIS